MCLIIFREDNVYDPILDTQYFIHERFTRIFLKKIYIIRSVSPNRFSIYFEASVNLSKKHLS